MGVWSPGAWRAWTGGAWSPSYQCAVAPPPPPPPPPPPVCTPPSGPITGVWQASGSSQIDPYAGAPGNVESNIGDITRRNTAAGQIGGNSGPWNVPGFMGVGCFGEGTSGSGTAQATINPPTGSCIVGERIASRVWGPSHSPNAWGITYSPGQTFFYTCVAGGSPPPAACVAPPPAPQTQSGTPQTRSPPCPAGQVGTWNQSRSTTKTRTITYSCPAPTGAFRGKRK